MNTQYLIAAAAIAFLSNGAFAIEAEQVNDAPSTLSRAVVKAELAQAQAGGLFQRVTAEYGAFQPAVMASVRSREEVRAEAFRAAHDTGFNMDHVGA